MRRIRLFVVTLAVAASLSLPTAVAAEGGPAPGESCVPGTIWEDLASGVKYICIYDELYGGTRWELLSGGQRGNEGWTHRSSTHGCALTTVGLTSLGGSGADAIIRAYRWPCARYTDRTVQPAGELRVRALIQRYDGGWTTCRDTGYRYSTITASGWLAGFDMGATPDCGAGTYRVWGYGAFYQGSGWRGGSLTSPSMSLR